MAARRQIPDTPLTLPYSHMGGLARSRGPVGALGLFLLCTLLPAWAEARINPLHVVTEQAARPDVMLILDTSASMQLSPDGGTGCSSSSVIEAGSDCGGNRVPAGGLPGVDICGDRMCSGLETNTSCSSDCPSSTWKACQNGSDVDTQETSRMFTVKRALRNILPGLRRSINFGLITFTQNGYFNYYVAGSGSAVTRTIYLSKREMEYLGAWNSGTNAPKTTFDSTVWAGNASTTYTLLSSSGLGANGTADSLYARVDNPTEEQRWGFASKLLSHNTGGYQWTYRGSYYTYQRQPTSSTLLSPAPSVYKGPQFVAGGTTYVYRPMGYETDCFSYQGITQTDTARIVVRLEESQLQGLQDQTLHRVLSRMNLASNGGLVSLGMTPSATTINTAAQHFVDKNNGTGFTNPDPARTCRRRFVVFLTDGTHTDSADPWDAAADLYTNATFTGNPIRTIAVGIPGLATSSQTELNRIADAGDDGNDTNQSCGYPAPGSCTAYLPTNEADLQRDLARAFYSAIQTDVVTGNPAATTSGTSTTTGDWAVMPSTEFPNWKGHLRAFNLTGDDPTEAWDAGQELTELASGCSRSLFTGYPTYAPSGGDPGDPVPLVSDPSGCASFDPATGLPDFSVAAVSDVWNHVNGAGSAPADADLRRMIKWLADDRNGTAAGGGWRLGPIVNSSPATLGPPPQYPGEIDGHEDFRNAHAGRERLAYVASHDGLLHAFRVALEADGGGDEVFAYLPPNLLPKVYALYLQGGQNPSPLDFTWVLGNSPRVEDVHNGSDWTTQLVLAMGPDNRAFVVLDITDPTDCSTSPCTLRTVPFTILKHSGQLGMTTLGEAWSVPALYWTDVPSNNPPEVHLSMGSGYGAATSGDKYVSTPATYYRYGHYYNTFDGMPPVTGDLDTNLHAAAGTVVDFAVLPDTAAAARIHEGGDLSVIAVYQADLRGRVVRYKQGAIGSGANAPKILIGPDVSGPNPTTDYGPLYYSPAVIQLEAGSDQVVLAANTGSVNEDDPPQTPVESRLILRSETNGEVSTGSPTGDYELTCAVSGLESGCGLTNTSEIDSRLTSWPTDKAQPVSTPILALNDPDGTGTPRVEAFFLLYEPAPNNNPCAEGKSFLVRIAATSATSFRLEDVQEVPGRATGMAIAGGGTDVVVAKVGRGGSQASLDTVYNNVGGGGAVAPQPVSIEKWREVR